MNEADLILHVRDAAHADSDAQRDDVIGVLSQLGIDADDGRPVIEVLNKIDLLSDDDRMTLVMQARLTQTEAPMSLDAPARIGVSAVTGEGVAELCEVIDALLTEDRETYRVTIGGGDGAPIAWLHAHGDVRAREDEDGAVTLDVRLSEKTAGQFRKLYPQADLGRPQIIDRSKRLSA